MKNIFKIKQSNKEHASTKNLVNSLFQDLNQILKPIKCKCHQHYFEEFQDETVMIYHSNDVPFAFMTKKDFNDLRSYKLNKNL